MTDSSPWYEDEQFWDLLAPLIMFGSGSWERAVREAEWIAELLEPGAVVLDLCCGPGRHCLELAQRGFRVTGVDRTTDYLETARRRSRAAGLEVELVAADMRRFCRPQAFDAVLSLSTSFGFFADPADDRRVLENVRRSLRDGGRLIMDLVGKEILARRFTRRTWHRLDNALVLVERQVASDWSWVDDRWILIRDGEQREFTMSHRPYSAAELCSLLAGCGFTAIEVYGSLTREPYDEHAERLVVLAGA